MAGGGDGTYRRWSGPARTMAQAVDAAVTAARTGDAPAFTEAATTLQALDREQLLTLLGAITRDLVERTHPDGLDSEDAEQLLQSAIRSAVPWYPSLDTDCLIRALTGALGVAEDEAAARIDEGAVLTHGLLLIADLLTGAPLGLPALIDTALIELHRAGTVELP